MKATLVLCFLLAGCWGGPSPADRATYEAIGPEYRAYVQADPSLDAAQQQRRVDHVEAWRLRVGSEKR